MSMYLPKIIIFGLIGSVIRSNGFLSLLLIPYLFVWKNKTKPLPEKIIVFLVGMSYEVLQNMNLNEMHEFYYQACILKSPHTEQARKCYQSYEESIYLAYTGSSGTHIPTQIKEKLNELEIASIPQLSKPFEKSELK